jgi:hypothetical protein
MSVLLVAHKKQAGLPVTVLGNPAVSSLRPVAFRPRLATGLALAAMELTLPKQEVKKFFRRPYRIPSLNYPRILLEIIQVDSNLFNVPFINALWHRKKSGEP